MCYWCCCCIVAVQEARQADEALGQAVECCWEVRPLENTSPGSTQIPEDIGLAQTRSQTASDQSQTAEVA